MDSANFINFIKNPGHLHQVSFQELNSLIEAYPYCQNLHYLAMMKAKIEQHKDFDKRLGLIATYCPDRQFLFKQVQDPIQPQSTSDSYSAIVEESTLGSQPKPDAPDLSKTIVPPSPTEDITDQFEASDSIVTESISDEILNPDIKAVEDESGSQLIIKKPGMELPLEDEKRKVVFLEDLINDNENVPEVSETNQNINHDEETSSEQDLTETTPLTEDFEEQEIIVKNEDIFPIDSNASTDDNVGVLLDQADNLSDRLELHDLPNENQEEFNPEIPIEETEKEEEENDFIEFPDSIIDDIPFEVTNLSDYESEPYDDQDELDFLDGEAYAEEAPEENSEQSVGFIVVDEKIELSLDDDDDELEDQEESSLEEELKEDISEDETDYRPLPKIAFKSWPEKYKSPYKQTITQSQEIEEEEKEELEPEKEQVPSKEKARKTINLIEVIRKAKKKSKRAENKVKKKKKAKKKKEKDTSIEIESKKKKKAKAKKKKKKKIKQLAEKSLTLKEDIISETLATLLVEQGNNKKAIKMYKKLSLIFPEKSAFFAAQIKKLKK